MKVGKAKTNSLIQVPTIKMWLKKRIHSEKKNYALSILNRFIQKTRLNLDTLIEQWKKVRFDYRRREQFLTETNETLEDYFYNHLEENTPASKHTIIYTIISFFKAHKIPIDPDVNERIVITYHNRAITKEEIRRILEHSSLKFRTFFLIMVESGQRPHTLVKLRYKHIKEDFEQGKVPMCITLPSQLLKDKVGDRFTFIGEDGYRLLKEYLEPRQPLDEDDVIFMPRRKANGNEYCSTENFSAIFSKTVLKLGLAKRKKKGKPKELRLYTLRKYFRNNIAMDRDYREFLMGHKSTLGVDQHYISRDKEYYRTLYEQGYHNLRIFSPEKLETSERINELTQLLKEKDKKLEEYGEKLEKLNWIVAKIVTEENTGALREAWNSFMSEVYSQMGDKAPYGDSEPEEPKKKKKD